jgi:cellobiose-specific phosphotransferase system component IIB
MERLKSRSDFVLAGGQHSWSMPNIGEPVDAIESVPVDVINAVGFGLGDDDDVLAVKRVSGVDGDDHVPLLGIA